MTKTNIIIIHGGMNFKTYNDYLFWLENEWEFEYSKKDNVNWKNNDKFLERFSKRKFNIVVPKMPNNLNAKYRDWEIVFNKIIKKFSGDTILIGHSLGGIFLPKFLSENKLSKNINLKSTYLIGAPFDNTLPDEYLGKDFDLKKIDLKLFEKQSKNIFLFFSKDDPIVPFSHMKKFKSILKNSKEVVFSKKGHFNQSDFKELFNHISKNN